MRFGAKWRPFYGLSGRRPGMRASPCTWSVVSCTRAGPSEKAVGFDRSVDTLERCLSTSRCAPVATAPFASVVTATAASLKVAKLRSSRRPSSSRPEPASRSGKSHRPPRMRFARARTKCGSPRAARKVSPTRIGRRLAARSTTNTRVLYATFREVRVGALQRGSPCASPRCRPPPLPTRR